MAYFVAHIAVAYRDACNRLAPNRDKATDGFIGNAAHQAEGLASQHNPRAVVGQSAIEQLDYANGAVLAVDTGNRHYPDDPEKSALLALASANAARNCPYVLFVNWNWMVANGGGGAWRTGGADGPDHNHVSFRDDAVYATYDWDAAFADELRKLGGDLGGGALQPTTPPEADEDDAMKFRTMKSSAGPMIVAYNYAGMCVWVKTLETLAELRRSPGYDGHDDLGPDAFGVRLAAAEAARDGKGSIG